MTWTKSGDGSYEIRQGDIIVRVTNGFTGPTWSVALDGGEVVRSGSANSLQGAMLKARHAAEELSRELLP